MANLQDFALIQQRVKLIQQRHVYENSGEAFDHLALQVILQLNEDEIQSSITDGAGDEGVDAIYVRGQDVYLISCKYTDKFENANRNFPEDPVTKMSVFIRRFMERTLDKNSVNDAVWEGVQSIWGALQLGAVNIIVHFFSNKELPLSHVVQKFDSDLREYRTYQVSYWDAKKIADHIIGQKAKQIDGRVQLIDKQYFDRSEGNIRGIVAPVPALELLKLVSVPDRVGYLDEDAFNDNIRVYYQLSNKINREIYDTALSEENYSFYYLNNGVTIVCEEYTYTPGRSPTLEIINLQIVNGGQTTHALAQAYQKDPSKLEDIVVLIKIFATKDRSLSDKIGEKTNRQTPINPRDLAANDIVQRKLEDEFASLGYYYERKNRQHEDKLDKPIVDSELMGQLYMSYYLDKPSEARNQKSVVFGEYYDDIFNPNVSAKAMLVPYELFKPLEVMKKDIQKAKRRREDVSEETAFVSRAVFHIINTVKHIGALKGINEFNVEELKVLIPEAIERVGEVVASASKERGGAYTHDKFFKEKPTNQIIINHVAEFYSKSPVK